MRAWRHRTAGRRRHGGLPLTLLALPLAACDDSPAPPPPTLNERVGGEVPIGAATQVRTGNPVGPILVDGETGGPVIRWFLDENVTAPTADAARTALADIAIASAVAGDSAVVRVAAVPASSAILHEALLSLGVPAARSRSRWSFRMAGPASPRRRADA